MVHDQFFKVVIGDDMCKYLTGMKFSALFVLACGSVVQVKEALDGLTTISKT